MPVVRYTKQPIKRVSDMEGDTPQAFELVRRILEEMDRFLQAIVGLFVSPGSPGSGSGPGAGLPTRIHLDFVANGRFKVDTEVDGGWCAEYPMEIAKITLWRGTPGTAGDTVLDINRDTGSGPVSLYTNQANRPRINYADADKRVTCVLPDVVSIAAGDVITVDTDEKESGRPRDWRLSIQGA